MTNWRYETLRYEIHWQWINIKHFFNHKLPWFIAFHVPRKVALFCFVRVYAVLGTCGPDYNNAYQLFESGKGK